MKHVLAQRDHFRILAMREALTDPETGAPVEAADRGYSDKLQAELMLCQAARRAVELISPLA